MLPAGVLDGVAAALGLAAQPVGLAGEPVGFAAQAAGLAAEVAGLAAQPVGAAVEWDRWQVEGGGASGGGHGVCRPSRGSVGLWGQGCRAAIAG